MYNEPLREFSGIPEDIDFSKPFSITVLIRDESNQQYTSELTVEWHKIEAVQEYPYKDNWVINGEKYYIHLTNLGWYVVLGNRQLMKQLWDKYIDYLQKDQDE